MLKSITLQLLKQTKSSKSWYLNHVTDQFVLKAGKENFRSRAAFKLIQINEKHHIIEKVQNVLDLGSAPGSWSQVVKSVNVDAKVAAVDLLSMKEIEGVEFYQQNALSIDLHEKLHQKYGTFGLIISDMAPNFSGTHFETHSQMLRLNKLCLMLALKMSSFSSNLIMKSVEGENSKHLFYLLDYYYQSVSRFKPKASRSESSEFYLICKTLKSCGQKKEHIKKIQEANLSILKSKKDISLYLQ